jgi:hypothetical protein
MNNITYFPSINIGPLSSELRFLLPFFISKLSSKLLKGTLSPLQLNAIRLLPNLKTLRT